MEIKIDLRTQIFMASLLSIGTIILLIYSLYSENKFLLGYSLGFSSFSSYYLYSKLRKYKEEVEKIWSGLTKSTTS